MTSFAVRLLVDRLFVGHHQVFILADVLLCLCHSCKGSLELFILDRLYTDWRNCLRSVPKPCLLLELPFSRTSVRSNEAPSSDDIVSVTKMGSETRAGPGFSKLKTGFLLISQEILICSARNLQDYFITSVFVFAEIFIITE